MPIPFEPDFSQKDIALRDDDFDQPNIGQDMQQTLAHLIAYFEAENRFKVIRADAQGRLHVTFGAVATGFGKHREISVPLQTVTQVLFENNNRRSYLIQNTGANDVRVNFDDSVSATNGFILAAGNQIEDDIYFGELFVFAQSGNTTLQVVEFV